MLDLIQNYVSGDFGAGIYNPVLWLMAWIVLATLVTGAILALSTRWQERRNNAYPFDAKLVLDPSERFSLRHLVSWHPVALALLSMMSAASLWLGWHIVVLPLSTATAVSYLWHFHLRRSGIRWAATYSLASWIVPYLVVIAMIILFGDALKTASLGLFETDVLSSNFRRGLATGWTIESLYQRLADLQPVLWSAIALWSLAALTASLALSRFRHPLITPWLVAAASCPVALCLWFITPWAIPLGAFTMVLLGHAMSRERRLRISAQDVHSGSSGDERLTRWPDLLATTKRFGPIVIMSVAATVTVVVLSYDEIVYRLVVNSLSVFELDRVWYKVVRTVVFWAPLVACWAVSYMVFPKVATPMQVAPYVASAILVAVLADALSDGDRYVRQLSWSDVRWPPDLERYAAIDSWGGPRLIWPSAIGIPLALSYVIAGASLLVTLWHAARGTVDRYGGLFCGAAWVVVVYWIFELTAGIGFFWGINLNDLLLANLTIAAIAMFALLYWGFGPGSIRTDPRQPRL